MKNKAMLAAMLAITLIISPGAAYAQQEAGSSAYITPVTQRHALSLAEKKTRELRRKVMINVLTRYNSPLVDEVDNFLDTCEEYDLNCYLLPAISGTESTFGRFIKPGSYNPFGWGGGEIMFDSWADGFDTVGKGLRENYINKGAVEIEQIGKIYAASPTWSQKIRFFMTQFEKEEQEQLHFSSPSVEL